MFRTTDPKTPDRIQEKKDVIARGWACLGMVFTTLGVALEEMIPWVRRISSVLGFALFISVESWVLLPVIDHAMHETPLSDVLWDTFEVNLTTIVGALLATSVFILLIKHLLADARRT